MSIRTKLIWGLLAGLAVLAGWWTLVPRIGIATEAEVRAHVAPELLLPLPHPAGGGERYEALFNALEPLRKLRQRDHKQSASGFAAFHLSDPDVRRAIDILESGVLDRTIASIQSPGIQQAPFMLADGLVKAAAGDASKGDWSAVRAQLQAAYLLLDRLIESDVTLDARAWTTEFNIRINRAVLALAARRDLPAPLAERLSTLVAVDRYGPESVRRVLRGEFQLRILKQVSGFLRDEYGKRLWVSEGTYDPIETTTLLGDAFVEASHNAGLPVSQWSSGAAERIEKMNAALPTSWFGPLQYLSYRVRMNTGRNTQGRLFAGLYNARRLMNRTLAARTMPDRVVAALAVCRFRQQAGRDPSGFDELIAAGLLSAAPVDHATEQPLPFDVKALFEWPKPAPLQTPKRN